MLFVHSASKARAIEMLVTLSRLVGRFKSATSATPAPVGAPRADNPVRLVDAQAVKAALLNLHNPGELSQSPLAQLALVSQAGSTASDLHTLLVDTIGELTESGRPRVREAGHLLHDEYVTRVGTNAVIMARLHMTRPTFYRRRDEGLALIANRIEELNRFALLVAA